MLRGGKNWFVILTKPRHEKKVNKNLKDLGFETCMPIKKELRIWNDRKKWIETPIFTSYVFINMEENKRDLVYCVPGILKFISFGNKLAKLSNKDIKKLELINKIENSIEIAYDKYKKGDKVKIISGRLTGLEGELIENGLKNKIIINIEGLSCYAKIIVEKSVVKKIY